MIILASNNQGKVNEIKSKVNDDVYSLKDLNVDIEIEENGKTLSENAKIKAQAIANMFPNDIIIADDTGLFVPSLNYQPGVYSARYAGESCNSEDNIDKLLKELENNENRAAYFETVVVVYNDNQYYEFSGILEGSILHSRQGDDGFGYDSVFYTEIFNKSLAQITKDEKNTISHRAKAIDKMLQSSVFRRENGE